MWKVWSCHASGSSIGVSRRGSNARGLHRSSTIEQRTAGSRRFHDLPPTSRLARLAVRTARKSSRIILLALAASMMLYAESGLAVRRLTMA
jgi:hypothetical protein